MDTVALAFRGRGCTRAKSKLCSDAEEWEGSRRPEAVIVAAAAAEDDEEEAETIRLDRTELGDVNEPRVVIEPEERWDRRGRCCAFGAFVGESELGAAEEPAREDSP